MSGNLEAYYQDHWIDVETSAALPACRPRFSKTAVFGAIATEKGMANSATQPSGPCDLSVTLLGSTGRLGLARSGSFDRLTYPYMDEVQKTTDS